MGHIVSGLHFDSRFEVLEVLCVKEATDFILMLLTS